MADFISDDLRQIIRELSASFQRTIGYFFILIWWCYFKLRIIVVPRLPKVFLTISLLELIILLMESHTGLHAWLSPSSLAEHIDDWFHVQIGRVGLVWLVTFSVVSIFLALFMTWHHDRVTNRVKEHLSLLSVLRQITAEATRLVANDRAAATEFVEKVLRMLTEATTKFKGQQSARQFRAWRDEAATLRRLAIVLEERQAAGAFRIVARWPQGCYGDLPTKLTQASAAGRVLKKSPDFATRSDFGATIYVPWTKFPHGIRLWVDESKSPYYCRVGFAKDVFEYVGDPKPCSMICVECPVESDSASRFVLCLDSNKRWCFSDVDFHAANLVASIIGIIFSDLEHASGSDGH
jgi:hypothetical protein